MADPKKGTGKKPKGSSRRLYTDENPKDTVKIKFATPADARATCAKVKKINRNPISSPENHTCCEAKGAISLLEKVSIEKFGDSTIPVSPKVKVRIIEDVHVPP